MDTEIYSYDSDLIRPICAVEFNIWGNVELLRASALSKEPAGIDTPELFESQVPKKGGLLDLRTGTTDDSINCATCGLNSTYCVGHFAHIALSEPVFHMGFLPFIKKILGCICLQCSKLLVYKNEKEINNMTKNKSQKSKLSEIRNIVKNVTYCQKANYGCGTPVSKIKSEIKKSTGAITLYAETNLANLPKEEGGGLESKKKNRQILTPEIVHNILKNISDMDCAIMGIDPKKSRPEMMVHIIFPVPPVAVRPSVKADYTGSGTMEDDLTHKLADILKANIRMARQKESENASKFAMDHLHLLQYHTAVFQGSDANLPKSEQKGKETKSLGPRLKGKEGRIRGNLEGKRVDFSARTVITSDPVLSINQLGVPVKIAMNLTYPEVVTPQNIEQLTKYVKNGRDVYPGANFVFHMSKSIPGQAVLPTDLRFSKGTIELKFGDIVERHLIDGDYVLLNRQPTLHKQSMMGHRVKVINDTKLNTFRLSACVTTPYNADFDGDEMNVFLPQSIQAQIELEELADVKKQLITPATSRTIIGIVQDGLVGAYNLTSPNMRIDWKSAMNIMSYTSIDDLKNFKKSGEYTGHEIFTMIIPPKINIIKGDGDKQLVIKNGKLERGQLTKDLLGSKKKNNITQLIWEEYGVDAAKEFLDNTQRLINNFNLVNGFTVGIGDTNISKDVENEIHKMIETKDLKVAHMITEYENNPDLMDLELFERTLYSELNVIREEASKLLVSNLSPTNGFIVMIDCGSKGDQSNVGQIGACAGLQAFEGKLVPKKINGRTLPYFCRDDDTSSSRGLIKRSFIKGLTLTEFYFLNLAGREGLIEGVIKTAESGYIQRKLIKLMEDLMIRYDGTARTASNCILQFIYGDLGADTTQQFEYSMKIMEMDDLEIARLHKFSKEEMKNFKTYTEEQNEEFYKFLLKMRDKLRLSQIKTRMSYITMSNTYMLPVNIKRIIDNNKGSPSVNSELTPEYVINKIYEIIENKNTQLIVMSKAEQNDKNSIKNKDDFVAKTSFLCALLESLSPKKCIFDYKMSVDSFDKIVQEIVDNFNKSMVEPGEMVGIIAAQSVGEPLSQLSQNKATRIHVLGDNYFAYNGPIGTFIDDLMVKNKNRVCTMDKPENKINNNESVLSSSILEFGENENYYIVSVSENEKISWKRISAISRHPADGKMINVKTRSGKETTATLSHSFLIRRDNKIIPIEGKNLKRKDRIPIAKYIPEFKDLFELYELDDGTDLVLDKDFGWFCGSYLADGSLNANVIQISKIAQEVEDNIKKITDGRDRILRIKLKQGHIRIKGIPRKYDDRLYNGKDMTFCDAEIAKFLKDSFGTGSHQKEIKDSIFSTNKEFISGIISGYIDGDGNINVDESHRDIRVHSVSKKLIDDMCLLLNYIGICGTICQETNDGGSVLNVLHVPVKYAKIFKDKIGLRIKYKADNLDKIIEYVDRDDKYSDREEIDMFETKSGIGNIIASIADKLGLYDKSRTYLRYKTKKPCIGRGTLIKFIKIFEKNIETQRKNSGLIDDEKVKANKKQLLLNAAVESTKDRENERKLTKIKKQRIDEQKVLDKMKQGLDVIGETIKDLIVREQNDQDEQNEQDKNKNKFKLEKKMNGIENIQELILNNQENLKQKHMEIELQNKKIQELNDQDAKSRKRTNKRSNNNDGNGDDDNDNDSDDDNDEIQNDNNDSVDEKNKNYDKNDKNNMNDKNNIDTNFTPNGLLKYEALKVIVQELDDPNVDLTELAKKYRINTIKLDSKAVVLKKLSETEYKKLIDELQILKDAYDCDVVWDEIKELKILPDPKEYVYDFTVPGTQTFMVDAGILVHNTLSSFHHSGIAAISTTTQGVPRIRELLSLTKNLKMPQMIIYLTKEYTSSRDMANKIASYIEFTTLGHIRGKLSVYYDPEPYRKGGFMEKDNVDKIFSTKSTNKYSCQSDINNLPWLMKIEFDKEVLYEREVSLLEIKSKLCNMWEKRHNEKTVKKEEKAVLDKIIQIAILSNTDYDKVPILHIRFDMTEFNIGLVSDFAEYIVDKFKLKGISGINNVTAINEERVITFDNEHSAKVNKKECVIYTRGTNLYDIRYLHGIDITKTISNDIVATYETFGIEAGRAALLREIMYAFERAGSSINYHHVALLIDQMTFTGYMTSVDRHGMKKSDVGPLSRASFEKTVDELQTAAVFGEVDYMNGVSSRIMAGLVIKGGTGLCNVILDTDMIQNSELTEDIGQKYVKTYHEITENNFMTDIVNKKEEEHGIFIPI